MDVEHLVILAFPLSLLHPRCCSFLCFCRGMKAPWLRLPQLVEARRMSARTDCGLKRAVFMSGGCTQRPAASTSATHQGCDTLTAAQRRQSFSPPLPLLSSVIKGGGKSRGEG